MYNFDESISIPRRTEYRRRKENKDKYVATGSCYNATMSKVRANYPLKSSGRWQNDYENYNNENNQTINNQEPLDDESLSNDLSISKDNNLESDVSNTESELSTTDTNESYSDTTITETDEDDDDDESFECENKFTHVMVILQYCTRHNLSHKAAKDLLSLIQALTPNSSPINQMNMKDIFNFVGETKLRIYQYCGNCGKLFPLDDLLQNICSTANCPGLRYFGTSGNNVIQRDLETRLF